MQREFDAGGGLREEREEKRKRRGEERKGARLEFHDGIGLQGVVDN